MIAAGGLTGCSPGNEPEKLGATNTIVVQGNTPQQLQVPENGRIVVYDVTMDHEFYSGPINQGQTVVVDPTNRTLSIDSKLATKHLLPANDELRINFDRTLR